jgi:hypothetical protein
VTTSQGEISISTVQFRLSTGAVQSGCLLEAVTALDGLLARAGGCHSKPGVCAVQSSDCQLCLQASMHASMQGLPMIDASIASAKPMLPFSVLQDASE